MLVVKNPETYSNRQTNAMKRKGMQSNLETFGSPIGISTNALDCKFDELKNIPVRKPAEYKG